MRNARNTSSMLACACLAGIASAAEAAPEPAAVAEPAILLAEASKPAQQDSNVPRVFGSAVTKLAQSGDWGNYRYLVDGAPACYALTVPVARDPAYGGDVYFVVARKPGPRPQFEPQLIVGDDFAANSRVSVAVAGRARTMFTHGRSAWLEEVRHEPLLVAEMKSGSTMTVSTKLRNGATHGFTFSLKGVGAALERMEEGC